MRAGFYQAALWLACVVLVPPASAQDADPIIRDALQANLQPAADARLPVVFAAPDLDLSGYDAVMLEPVTISYERGEGRMYRLGKAQMEALQQHGKAALEKQLSGDDGYKVVDEPGPGTISIRASLQNVLLAFPEGANPGEAKTRADYTVKMSLEAELVDSQTGEVLMIVADRKGDTLSTPREVTGADAWAEADKAFNYWAGILRQRLDGARGKKP